MKALTVAGLWRLEPWSTKTDQLIEGIIAEPWRSGGLPETNVFTTAFMLEATSALLRKSERPRESFEGWERIKEGEERLLNELQDGGSASLEEYPPSAYLTQLAVRVLRNHSGFDADIRESVVDWAYGQVYRQLALLRSGSRIGDVFQLAYAVLIVTSLVDPEKITPPDGLVLQRGLEEFFERQLEDGSWPPSQPLFHYPKLGNAYCYEYEVLVQLLSEDRLQERLLPHLPALARAAYATRDRAYQLDETARGWSSGHLVKSKGPESWATASVLHYSHVLDRLLSEGIRRSVFAHLEQPYTSPSRPSGTTEEFGEGFVDCSIVVDGRERSLLEVVRSCLLGPIVKEIDLIRGGGSLSRETPMSAILFGPPGTSKTELTRRIASFLGWPQLTVDPSFFLREGLDRVLAEASRLFSMLAVSEEVVVLLDEIDELVRKRTEATELLSRFFTTGMLPRLAEINRNRRILFIVATNHIEMFDPAISRHGRFDLILQIMPPTLEAKLDRWPEVNALAERLEVPLDSGELSKQLAPLTFMEFEVLVRGLASAANAQEFLEMTRLACERCTLEQIAEKEEKEKTWAEVSRDQRSRVRVGPGC